MTDLQLDISITEQTLLVKQQGVVVHQYSVSTAKNGPNQKQGSFGTPLGKHIIQQCIGEGMPLGAVFVGRQWTGEVWDEALDAQYPDRDWILTRILWLSGREPGFNAGGDVDSQSRYIYIHGTPDNQPMGVACSHGCIRMCNHDVLALFAQVNTGTPVVIYE